MELLSAVPEDFAMQSAEQDHKTTICLSGPPRKNPRRPRILFEPETTTRLGEIFADNQYPDIALREKLSEELGIPEQRIQVKHTHQAV